MTSVAVDSFFVNLCYHISACLKDLRYVILEVEIQSDMYALSIDMMEANNMN